MDESEILDDIFVGNKFKDKYRVSWCCDSAQIFCPVKGCGASTCNSRWCDKSECMEIYNEFRTLSRKVENYLTKEEQDIWKKGLKIQELILKTTAEGLKEIPFKELKEKGEFSINDEKLFEKELL